MAMECPICLDEYSADLRPPKMIRCGHSACLQCLRQVPSCPRCRKHIFGRADDLPTNFDLLGAGGGASIEFWCLECGAVADVECRRRHPMIHPHEALRQHMQGVTARATEAVQGLAEVVRAAAAAASGPARSALQLLSGPQVDCDLTVRQGGASFSARCTLAEDAGPVGALARAMVCQLVAEGRLLKAEQQAPLQQLAAVLAALPGQAPQEQQDTLLQLAATLTPQMGPAQQEQLATLQQMAAVLRAAQPGPTQQEARQDQPEQDPLRPRAPPRFEQIVLRDSDSDSDAGPAQPPPGRMEVDAPLAMNAEGPRLSRIANRRRLAHLRHHVRHRIMHQLDHDGPNPNGWEQPGGRHVSRLREQFLMRPPRDHQRELRDDQLGLHLNPVVVLMPLPQAVTRPHGDAPLAEQQQEPDDEQQEQQEPQDEEQAPQDEEQAPQDEQQAPQAEQQAPQAEQQAPQAEQQAPQAEQQAPQDEQQAPQDEQQAPQAEQAAPEVVPLETAAPRPQPDGYAELVSRMSRRPTRPDVIAMLDMSELSDTDATMRRDEKEALLETIWRQGVKKLDQLVCSKDPVWASDVLRAAWHDVEELSLLFPGVVHMRAMLTLPLLRRLAIKCSDQSREERLFVAHRAFPAPNLEWLSLFGLSRTTTRSLLRQFGATLETLRMTVGTPGDGDWPHNVIGLENIVTNCHFNHLRRLVLNRGGVAHSEDLCFRQKQALRHQLPRGVHVLCGDCDRHRGEAI